MLAEIIAIVIAYLVGSISSGVIFAKLMGSTDPRTVGSGSAGATNVLRTMGKYQALTVLIIDALKGVIAVVIGHAATHTNLGLGLVVLAVVAGHVFPVFFKFKGGKGVATMIGALFAMHWAVGLLAIIIWVAVALITRFSSLASICALGASVIFSPMYAGWGTLPAIVFGVALVLWKHKDNIMRLKNDTEPKIDFNEYLHKKETVTTSSMAPSQPAEPTVSSQVNPTVSEAQEEETHVTPAAEPPQAKPTVPSNEEMHKPSITDPTADDEAPTHEDEDK